MNTCYTQHYRPKKLSAYISRFTVYQFTDLNPVRLNPGGFFELIFQVGGDFEQSAVTTDKWQVRPGCFLGGLHNKSYYVQPRSVGSKLISVSFKPNCARHFIPDRLNLYKNTIADLHSVFGKAYAPSLFEQSQSNSIENVITLIEDFLAGSFKMRPESPVDLALLEIYKKRGFVNVQLLATLSCLSQSHLRRRFNEEIGLSPKEYSKIVRVNVIADLLALNPGIHLTDLTYQLGYFDQAHFIKDFKSVTGCSPKNYIS